MIFCPKSYQAAVKQYAQNWRLQDQTLRRLCQKHPTHEDGAAVRAKIWIVGRTFAAGIERVVDTDHTQGGAASKVAEYLLRRHNAVDGIIRPLRSLCEPLTMTSLMTVIQAHGRFLKLLEPITNKAPRSFVSKYLHFHCATVPIFDAVASASLRSRVRWLRAYDDIQLPAHADEEYGYYCIRFWHLYSTASRQLGKSVSVRGLEYSLLCDTNDVEV